MDNATSAAVYLGSATDATMKKGSTCDVTTSDGDGMTDAVFEEIQLGFGVGGQTWCNTSTASGKCDRAGYRP